jgi:hypothetical protein
MDVGIGRAVAVFHAVEIFGHAVLAPVELLGEWNLVPAASSLVVDCERVSPKTMTTVGWLAKCPPQKQKPLRAIAGVDERGATLVRCWCGDLAGAVGNHQNRYPQGDHSAERHNAADIDLGQFVSGLYRKALVHG